MLNFDHNGHEKMEELPLIERFTHRMPHDQPFNGAYFRSSTLYRVQDTIRTGIHNSSKLVPRKVFVDVNGQQMVLSPYMHGKDVVTPIMTPSCSIIITAKVTKNLKRKTLET